MRALAALAVLAAAALAATATGNARPQAASCAKASLDLVSDGKLTIGTDNPAYPPWFGGDEKAPWKVSDPRSGKGYESAVAYAVAKQLGFAKGEVEWKYVPFGRSFAPGKKSFDFDINQISYSPARAKVVSFSDSYYDVNQALVVKKGTKIANVRTRAGLKRFKLGAQLGTTSYQYIVDVIKPTQKPSVYPKNDFAVTALKNGQIDGLVVDLPTAFYVTAVQVPNSKILGQFPAGNTQEHFGMVFQKGNPLVACVNAALKRLKANGTMKQIQTTWLSKVVGVPTLK
jgi:polar amino acid transport system substrate-binding protein